MTGIFMDTGQSKNQFESSFAQAPGATAAELFELSRENTLRQNISISDEVNMERTYDDRIDQFEKLFNKRLPNPWTTFIPEAHPDGKFNFNGKTLVDVQIEWFENQVNEARNTLPENQRGSLMTFKELQASIPQAAQARQKRVNEAFENSSTLGKAAGIAGDLAAFMQDPVILATLPINWPSLAGRTTLQAMARVGISEALIAGGSEAIIQPIVQQFRKELGFKDAGFDAGLRNVIFAMAGGGVLGSGLAGLSKQGEKFLGLLAKMNSNDSRVLSDALKEKPDASSADKALAGQLEKDADQVDDNPLWQGPEQPEPLADIDIPPDKITEQDITAREQGQVEPETVKDIADRIKGKLDEIQPETLGHEATIEHDKRTIEADKAAEDGGLPDIPDEPAIPPSGEVITSRAGNVGSTAELVDPRTLTVDAKRFQFKSLTDDAGVSTRLADVKEWDQTKAGLTLVWEDAQGQRFIADGHQRTALAKKLLQDNPDADIRLLGIIRKESDGFSAEDVMVEAAMKNIAETDAVTPQLAIDAAKVMRIRPDEITALLKSLPPRSTMVRTVGGLIELTDRSFSHVINQKVSATHGAMVARLVQEPNLQDAIMDVLVREQVIRKTDIEAEAIIRQAREVGTKREVQDTLFGEEVFETSLFSERAKVLQKTLQKLRKEKSVFRNLVKNKGKIESEGNALKTDANQQIADESAVAVELLMKLANRTGALSDALTNAARQAAETKKFGPAVDQFVDSVREAITRGDFEGVKVGGAGRAGEPPKQDRADNQQATAVRDVEEVKGFDEVKPGAVGPEVQSRIFDDELATRSADPVEAEKKVPIEFTDPNTGKQVTSAITIKEIAEEAKGDDLFLNGLTGCIRSKQ